MRLIFRPIDQWPGELTPATKRKPAQFSATWSDTLEVLERELDQLGVFEAVIQVAADERAMRLDGGLRADAKVEHPGVILSFETKRHGPLRYATDVFSGGTRYNRNGGWQQLSGWQMNARAIALSLEALRKVDRYGVTRGGEQYRGFTAIGSGTPMPAAQMTVEDAARFIAANSGGPSINVNADRLLGRPDLIAFAYRSAARKLHPDAGGSTEDFRKLQEAKRILDQAAS
jgi:hypothetical protein